MLWRPRWSMRKPLGRAPLWRESTLSRCPNPWGLDFKSSVNVQDLLAGDGLIPVPDAGTYRGANLLADPGIAP